jgi:hypothetical protein
VCTERICAFPIQGSVCLACLQAPRACVERSCCSCAARPFEVVVARVVLRDVCKGEGGYASDSSGNTKKLRCIGGFLPDAAWNTRNNVRTWPQSLSYCQVYPCCESCTMPYHHLIRSHLYLHHGKVNVTEHGMRMCKRNCRLNVMWDSVHACGTCPCCLYGTARVVPSRVNGSQRW